MSEDTKKSVFTNIADLRITGLEVGAAAAEREVDARIPVRKPEKHEFFRVHPDPGMSLTTTVIMDKEEMRNDCYLVLPEAREVLASDVRGALLVPAITRQGVLMIWPIMLPVDGRANDWHERARAAAERAKRGWVRLAADMAQRTYRIFEAVGDLPEPVWPDKPINEMLETAFAGKIIANDNHPLVRRLQGRT